MSPRQSPVDVPQDVINEIIDYIGQSNIRLFVPKPDYATLRSCSLVSRAYRRATLKYLFHGINPSTRNGRLVTSAEWREFETILHTSPTIAASYRVLRLTAPLPKRLPLVFSKLVNIKHVDCKNLHPLLYTSNPGLCSIMKPINLTRASIFSVRFDNASQLVTFCNNCLPNVEYLKLDRIVVETADAVRPLKAMSLRKLSISHSDLSPFLVHFLEASRLGQVPNLDSFELLYCDMDDATVAALFTNPCMHSLSLDLYQIKYGETTVAVPFEVFGDPRQFQNTTSSPKLPPQRFSASLDTLSIPFSALKWFIACIPLLKDANLSTIIWTHDGLPAEVIANIPPLPAIMWREFDQRICETANVRVATVRIDNDPWSWEQDIIECSPNMIKRGMLQWGNSALHR